MAWYDQLSHRQILIKLVEAVNNLSIQGELVAAIDDLNTQVTRLQTDVADLITKVQEKSQDTAIEAAATTLSAVADSAEAILNPPAPAPADVPPVP